MDVVQYLERLQLKSEFPTLRFLKKLQLAHLKAIPFENLEIHYGNRILLDYRHIENKILGSKRGGYCFELNGLFSELLKKLGFECYLSSASFYMGEEKYSDEMDHMLIIVELDEGSFVTDVGLIDGFHQPKLLTENEVFLDHIYYYRWGRNPDGHFLLQKSADGISFKTYYRTPITKKSFIEFLHQNDKHQDSLDSFFVQNKIASRLDEMGQRIKLTGDKLEIIRGSESKIIEISNEDDFLSKLEEFFGITYDSLIQ